jgi:hypothetical protein
MLGYGSNTINGQLVAVPETQAFAPLTFGSMFTGPSLWPRNGVYNQPPVMPSPGTWAGSTNADSSDSSGAPMSGSITGSPTTAGALTGSGGVNYFSPTKSPLVMALLFLGLGLAGLHYIHYKK